MTLGGGVCPLGGGVCPGGGVPLELDAGEGDDCDGGLNVGAWDGGVGADWTGACPAISAYCGGGS